ncbi:hypothetical protein AB0F07_39230 [Streptomyces fructofermentans]|uniref:hypothetical protein n=1 Tax=Streptomyces fructofermentans TaxID=152141 RepID=UPI0033F1D0BA
MTSRAKVPDDGEAMRGRVRDLIQKAHHLGVLGHGVRAKLDKEVLKEDTAAADVGPPIPAQKKPPCEDASEEDPSEEELSEEEQAVRAEVARQIEMVGKLARRARRHAARLRVSSSSREDISQDALAKVLKRIEGAPLELNPREDIARFEMEKLLKIAVHSAYVDHLRKVTARARKLAKYTDDVELPKKARDDRNVTARAMTPVEYTDDIELPRTAEGGKSAETAFFAMTDKSMAEALTAGFASSMDDAVKEAERLATAMHDLVGTKELLCMILHKAFAVPADVVAEMTDSTPAAVRSACAAAAPKLRKREAKRTFLVRLNRADAD